MLMLYAERIGTGELVCIPDDQPGPDDGIVFDLLELKVHWRGMKVDEQRHCTQDDVGI